MGYCPHTSNMFSTWHRPYLALFEQVLQQNAKEVAQQYPPGEIGDKYQDAAKKLRLPYWDWAIDPPDGTEGSMPDSLRRPNQTITTFNGTQQQIPNPLLQYNFHPLDPAYFAPLVSRSEQGTFQVIMVSSCGISLLTTTIGRSSIQVFRMADNHSKPTGWICLPGLKPQYRSEQPHYFPASGQS